MNMEPRNIPNTMTEEEYDRGRLKLRETYGSIFGKKASVEARAKGHMALCKLFVETQWTFERLAKKEGVDRRIIARRCLFGRFLIEHGTVGARLPNNLTENLFRDYWKQTDDMNPHGLGKPGPGERSQGSPRKPVSKKFSA